MHLGRQRAAERLALRGQLGAAAAATGRPRPHRPRPTPAAPHPARSISCHQPANKSSALPRSGSAPPTASASTPSPSSAPAAASPCGPDRTRPAPDIGGNQKSHWAISPATYAVRDAGSGGRYTGRNSATRSRQRPDRPRPADPLGDHRRRHRRHTPAATPGSAARPIHHRPRRPALIPRRPPDAQRRPHRVPRHAKHPRDLLDRHPLRPMQTPDLRPVLHGQHPLPPRLD